MDPKEIEAFKEAIAWGVESALQERSRVERRERIATKVMEGLAADADWPGHSAKIAAGCAVEWADALIAELDKEN